MRSAIVNRIDHRLGKTCRHRVTMSLNSAELVCKSEIGVEAGHFRYETKAARRQKVICCRREMRACLALCHHRCHEADVIRDSMHQRSKAARPVAEEALKLSGGDVMLKSRRRDVLAR